MRTTGPCFSATALIAGYDSVWSPPMRTSRLADCSTLRQCSKIWLVALSMPKGVTATSPASTTWRSKRGRCCTAIMYGRISRELARTASGPNLAPGRKLQPESNGTPTTAMSMSRPGSGRSRTETSTSPPSPPLSLSRRLLHAADGHVQRASFAIPRLVFTSRLELTTSSSRTLSDSLTWKANSFSEVQTGFRLLLMVCVFLSAPPSRATTYGSDTSPMTPVSLFRRL
mmetsp:Transcript_76234/g.215740  ORF Transcript_76234/g.215740 Transcript_76234/m.215740 type:complete len:228 (+) Transcript_76234:715-1398(+)